MKFVLSLLLSLFCINPSFSATTNNLYDANGHLIASCSDETGCNYLVYKGLSQIGQIKSGKYQHYLIGPQGKLAVIDKDKTQSSQTLTWLTTDFHNSVMVSSVGSTPQQNTLDAFGNDLQPESSFKEKIYTDKHAVDDAESLYNFNARFYDAEIGRFTITDPIAQENLNWFTAFNNNPLSFVDINGKNPVLLVVAACAANPLCDAAVVSVGVVTVRYSGRLIPLVHATSVRAGVYMLEVVEPAIVVEVPVMANRLQRAWGIGTSVAAVGISYLLKAADDIVDDKNKIVIPSVPQLPDVHDDRLRQIEKQDRAAERNADKYRDKLIIWGIIEDSKKREETLREQGDLNKAEKERLRREQVIAGTREIKFPGKQ